MSNQANGRVNILGDNNKYQFTLFDNPGKPSGYQDALVGNWKDNMLSKAFFSPENEKIIQNGIRAGVYKRSSGRYVVAPQDETNLKIIMRSIFLQNAKNIPTHITEQIAELNQHVLDYCISNVFSEASAYIKYRNDVSTLAVPLKRPAFISVKGDKQLEFKRFF